MDDNPKTVVVTEATHGKAEIVAAGASGSNVPFIFCEFVAVMILETLLSFVIVKITRTEPARTVFGNVAFRVNTEGVASPGFKSNDEDEVGVVKVGGVVTA